MFLWIARSQCLFFQDLFKKMEQRYLDLISEETKYLELQESYNELLTRVNNVESKLKQIQARNSRKLFGTRWF